MLYDSFMRGSGRENSAGGRGPFVGGSTGGRGTARTMASEQSGNSSSLKIDKKELAKMLGQVLEAAKTGTGLLGKIFSAKDAAQLSVSLLNDTIVIGLRDISWYQQVGLHLPSMQGSLVDWSQVNWSKWDTGGSPEQTMSNLFRAAMKEND